MPINVLDVTRRSLVEAYAAPYLAVPADLWLFGQTVESLLTAEGLVDEAAVVAAAEALTELRPRLRTLPTPVGVRWRP